MDSEVFMEAVYWFSLPAMAMLAMVLLSKRLVKRIPFFFSYVVVGVLIDIARLLTLTFGGQNRTYFFVYWISDIITTVLALLVTAEVALGQLFPRFQRVKLYRYLFGVSGAIIAISAILTAANNRTLMQSARVPLVPILMRTLHTVDFLRVALLLFFLLLMFLMGREWGGYELGIAFGLAVNAAGLLTTFAMWTKYLRDSMLPTIAYDTACIIWLITFLHRARTAPIPVKPADPKVVELARRWTDSLKKSLVGKKSANRL